ncbi:unnamed protein product [Ilex paraguariensis]
MDCFLEELFQKRGSKRESALAFIIEGFTMKYQRLFAQQNFATLLYRCLNSFKKGSSKEIGLACHALGLLAITIGCGANAHELYREAIDPLSKALKSAPETFIPSILECLAIVTFIGRSNVEETEKAMQIIWRFIHLQSGFNGVARKHSAVVLTSAISAWSFLLTSMDSWNLSYNHWQGAIDFFLNILETDGGSVLAAASESLALIFEVESFDKFVCDTKVTSDSSICKEGNCLKGFSSTQELKEAIIGQVRSLSQQAEGCSSASKVVNNDCKYSWDIVKVLEEDCFPETSVKIGHQILRLCTWSQLLQMNYLKNFLGGGFLKHMLENEQLHDVFDFTPKPLSSNEPYVCEREEVSVHYFVPQVRKKDNKDCCQRLHKSRNSAASKARTQQLNKQRTIRAEELRISFD